MRCVFLFDTSGVMAQPWAAAGYACECYDIQNDNTTRDGVRFIHWDANAPLSIPTDNVYFAACWPPCTDIAVSGARWMKGKGLRALQESIGFFATSAEFCNAADCIWMIENPRSTIATYWRPPDHTFHPAHFNALDPASSYAKTTCIWCSDNFTFPAREMDPQLDIDMDFIHRQPPGPERANIRSRTPLGYALATYEANKPQKGIRHD